MPKISCGSRSFTSSSAVPPAQSVLDRRDARPYRALPTVRFAQPAPYAARPTATARASRGCRGCQATNAQPGRGALLSLCPPPPPLPLPLRPRPRQRPACHPFPVPRPEHGRSGDQREPVRLAPGRACRHRQGAFLARTRSHDFNDIGGSLPTGLSGSSQAPVIRRSAQIAAPETPLPRRLTPAGPPSHSTPPKPEQPPALALPTPSSLPSHSTSSSRGLCVWTWLMAVPSLPAERAPWGLRVRRPHPLPPFIPSPSTAPQRPPSQAVPSQPPVPQRGTSHPVLLQARQRREPAPR